MSKTDPFQQGRDAYFDQETTEDNPYPNGTEENQLWLEGYEDAASEDEDEDNEDYE